MPNAESDLVVGKAYRDTNDPNGGAFLWDGKNRLPAVKDPTSGRWVVDRAGLVNAGTPGALQTAPKLNPADDDLLKSLQADAAMKQTLADRARQFMAIQGTDKGSFDTAGGVATGPAYADWNLLPFAHTQNMIPNLAKAAHDALDPQSRIGQMDAINRATWAYMRQKGAGPIRNFESSDWKQAFPNTSNYGPVNDSITNRLGGDASDALGRLKFVSDFVSQGRGPGAAGLAAFEQQRAAARMQQDPRGTMNAALIARSQAARAGQGGGGNISDPAYRQSLASEFGGQ